MQTWDVYARAVRDFHYALFFELEGQRAARQKEIRAALQSVEAVRVPIDGWCRVANFKYALTALSPAGSLTHVGGRFNFGRDIDEARFAPFRHCISQKTLRQPIANIMAFRKVRRWMV
jgi:hypothetical protein